MGSRVRARPGNDRGTVSHGLGRGHDKPHALLIGERRRLASRSGDDDTVGTVLDQVRTEIAERVVVDRPVVMERSHCRCQYFTKHDRSLGRNRVGRLGGGVQNRVKAVADAGRQISQPFEGQQNTRSECVARARIVANRERLTCRSEDDLLVGD